jgi:hypothetical protein
MIGPARDIPEKLDLCVGVENIETWIRQCQRDHISCNPLSPILTDLPRRVLDLKPQQPRFAARLIETNGLKGKYVALSHCWGGDTSVTITTTRATLPQRQVGIPWEELPQTFRDAIMITEKLGVRYIWIDSLCIIQGDSRDWEQESAKMASTYSNCYLNIAATHARNGTGGCLSKRWTPFWTKYDENSQTTGSRPVISHEVCSLGKPTGVFVRNSLRVAHAQCTSDLQHETQLEHTAPLLGRAWCYQERLLSPRTVHFHSSEMIWHCIEAVCCECGELDNINAEVEYMRRSTFPKCRFNLADHDLGSGYEQHDPLELWRTIVYQYSKMRLTNPSDVLPALSGVALRYKQKMNTGRYLAGLWERGLTTCLLWQVYSHPEANPGRKYIDTYRSATYRAPTWSWASIEFDQTYRSSVSYYDVDYDCEIDPEFSVVNVSVDLAGSEFGQVVGGLLQVRCRVLRGMLDRSRSDVEFEMEEENRLRLSEDASPEEVQDREEVNLDYILPIPTKMPDDNPLRSTETIQCLLVARVTATGDGAAIIVKALKESPGRFERIGYMTITNNMALFENAAVVGVDM